MEQIQTVSGNTVSGNIPPQPETVTNNNTYTIDNTDVCTLLASLLEEEKKQNGALSRLNETLSAHTESLAQSGILDSLQAQVLAEDLETGTEETETETEDTETLYRDTLFETLDAMNNTLSVSRETLDSISKTVSDNNTALYDMDGTANDLSTAYMEQTEKNTETESYKLAIGITLIFAVTVLIGILLSRISWHKMR